MGFDGPQSQCGRFGVTEETLAPAGIRYSDLPVCSIVTIMTELSRVLVPDIRGGADKSLARPTSRCRRTESIEGSVHVPNCKSFLVTKAERKHVRRCA